MFEEEGDGASANFVATPKTERLEAEDEDEDEDEDEGDVDFKPPLLRRTSTAGAAILNEPLVQKVPRGRSIPPVPPKPVERRRSSVLGGRRGSSNQRRKSQQILFVPKEQLQPGPKKPEWQTAYFGFKRKVQSSFFFPALLILFLGSAGIHLTALSGAGPPGYFTWDLLCDTVVSGATGPSTSVGLIKFDIGWASFKGVSEAGSGANQSLNSVTISATLSAAVSSSLSPLSSVDTTTAALGGLTAAVHILGMLGGLTAFAICIWLFRSHFRSQKNLFKGMLAWTAVLLVSSVAIASMGFYWTTQYKFTDAMVSKLESEGLACRMNRDLNGRYAFIATGFTCVTHFFALIFLVSRFRQADAALKHRFERRRSLGSIELDAAEDEPHDAAEKGKRKSPGQSRQGSEKSVARA